MSETNKHIYGPLQQKTLENSLILHLIENYGYNTKPKVAEALIKDLMSIYAASTKDKDSLKSGQILWPAVSIKEKHGNGKTLAKTKTISVVLSVLTDSDIKDLARGIKPRIALAKRIARISGEAYSQGGLLTQADVAAIFCVSQPKVSQLVRGYQKDTGKVIPLRGLVHDIGRSITHKVKIIKMHTDGFSTKDIARSMSHAPTSVDRYIRDFERVKLLFTKGMSQSEIAYITSLSESLVIEYIKIVKELMLKK
jgi:predicted XRE-type DNA-binding protein